MARAVDQFRASDVTFWGLAALGIWAVAVFGANVSALVPQSVYAALHASRLDGSTLNQLGSRVASLEDETARGKRETNQLLQRLSMNEDTANAVARRVGALEVSVPRLIEESRVAGPGIDNTATGSVGADILTFEVEGGTVAVQQRPLVSGSDDIKLKLVPLSSPMPPAVPDGSATGVRLGFPVQPSEAEAQWQAFLAQAGTMLVGLSPVLADAERGEGKLIVAGPTVDKASAIDLCESLGRTGIPCEPVPFSGVPMPLLN